MQQVSSHVAVCDANLNKHERSEENNNADLSLAFKLPLNFV